MENGKIILRQCPKCRSCGITEKIRQWETDRDPIEDLLVGYYECENCHHVWSIVLDVRKRESQVIPT